MYVFIEMEIPTCTEGTLYNYDINENWKFVEQIDDVFVYAYGENEMTELHPRDTTTELMSNITMTNISNAEYSEIADINLHVRGYGIDTDGSSDISTVWETCKELR